MSIKKRTSDALLWGCLWSLLGLASAAHSRVAMGAPADERATLGLQFSGIKYATTVREQESGDLKAAKKTTSIVTSDLVDAYIWASIGRFNLYFYPFQDSNALLSGSYMILDELELGLDFGYNKVSDDSPKSELSRNIYGVFATHYISLGPIAFENSLLYDISRGRSLTTDGDAERETTLKGSFLKLSITALYPLAKNAWYYAGAWYSIQKEEANDGATNKYHQLNLTLAGFRIAI